MIDTIYHMTLRFHDNAFFDVKTSIFCHNFTQRYNVRHYAALLDL